jgi:hypothetical protein
MPPPPVRRDVQSVDSALGFQANEASPTGYRSIPMVRRYIRDGGLFRENGAGKLGL